MYQLKRTPFLMITCCLSLLAGAQVFPHHIKEDGLLGKVKKISVVNNDESRELYMYNEEGWQTERWFFKPVGVLDHRYKAVYNEEGQLVAETKFDKGIAPVLRYTYGYNDKGLLIGRSLHSQNNTLLEKFIYEYDPAKRKTNSIKLDQYGNILNKDSISYRGEGKEISYIRSTDLNGTNLSMEYIYDPSGKLSATRSLMNGVLRSQMLFSYKNNEEERQMFGINGKLEEIVKYDTNRRVKSVAHFLQDGKLQSKEEYIFDNYGNMLEETKLDGMDRVAVRLTYKYDSLNNKIETKRYYGQTNADITLSWQYEYDATGNWIKRTEMLDGVLRQTIKREIEYY